MNKWMNDTSIALSVLVNHLHAVNFNMDILEDRLIWFGQELDKNIDAIYNWPSHVKPPKAVSLA